MIIDVVKILITLFIFIKASIHDLREREIPDEFWKFMVTVGLILDVVQYFMEPYDLTLAVVQFILIFALANFMFYIAGFGGADAKALIALSIMFPVYPDFEVFPLVNKGVGIFAFSVLSNSVIVAPFLALYFFIRNMRERNCRLLYRFIGVRVDADRIPRFYNLLEYVDEGGKIVRTVRGIEPDEDMLNRLKEAKERGIIDRVWVTPALPFLVFINFGLIVSAVFGDLLVWAITQIITLYTIINFT